MTSGEPSFQISKDGDWINEGIKVTHPKVIDYLFSCLRKKGNEYYLQSGPKQFPVTVDDVPYVVREIIESESGFTLRLNDKLEENLDFESLRIGSENVLYCSIKNGKHEARFNRPTYYQIAKSIERDPNDQQFYLKCGGKRYQIAS